MKTKFYIHLLFYTSFIISFIVCKNEVYASHAEGADLTYKCLGGNQYELTVSFYRDCYGINAPSSATVNCLSQSTNQNFNITLQPIPGTGQEVSLVCLGLITECQGGTYPGVQEWVYRGTVIISPASDWVFSFSLCCRNAAITTIQNPSGQDIYVEATLDNLNFPCNSSPTFTTKPIPFVCLYQNYTFNNGAGDPDGDFLTYELITPMNGPNSSVIYFPPYTAIQPLTTNPAMGFDTVTGDINMKPTMLEVTILAVKVKQWRNNQLIGTVIRDIQLRTMNCNNSYPYINGINGTGTFMATACAGSAITFNVYTQDPDSLQVLTLTWNNGITGATFNVSAGINPTGTFSWTPTIADVGTHCFTVTVKDNNCPINGSLTYAICLVVYGINASVTTTSANCGASNGTLFASASGGTAPYSYQWLPCGCNNNPLNGQQAGTYTVIVTDSKGCTAADTGIVNGGAAPGNVNVSSVSVSCFGGSNGTATANANGGQPPYTYLWSNGSTASTATGLSSGTYTVLVTTAQGCTKIDSVTITNPTQLSVSVIQNDALCNGMSNGSAAVNPTGGTPPYTYLWNNGSTTQSITGLPSGNYFVTVTDSKGCVDVQNISIGQPAPIILNISAIINTSCFGGSNGSATASAFGGVSPYSYLWNNGQTSQTATGLTSGSYIVTVLDSNGCTTIVSCTISDPPVIMSAISSVAIDCFGNSSGSASVNVSGGTPPYSYLWSNAQTTSSATNLSAGNYSVIITDANGCSMTDMITILQPSFLAIAISNVQGVLCNHGNNGSATASASGGTLPYTFLWSNGQTTSSVSSLSAGSYSVIITDANGCSSTDTITITQPGSILVSISPADTICPGNNSIISASASGGTSPFTYFWQPNVGFGNSQTVNPNTTTTYTAIITDANGCTSSSSTTIHVHNMNLGITMNSTPSICFGQSGTISASVNGNSTGISYYWSNNLGAGAGPFTISPAATTTYSVVVTNLCGASATASSTVIVNPLPQINIPPMIAAGCDNAILQFTDTNLANNGSAYYWSFGDGTFSSAANPLYTYSQTGTYLVNVTVTSPAGCSSQDQTTCTAIVTVSPVADFDIDQYESSIINPVFRFTDLSVNADTWSWNFGDGQTSVEKNPVHTYKEKGLYTVKLVTTNSGGCIDSIIKLVRIEPEFTFYIPNTFTPDGDNLNDIFTGVGMEIAEFEMQIYDRWGEMIYETQELTMGWNGTVKGGSEIAQQDVYVYQIKLRDTFRKQHQYTGHVNLIK